MMPNPFTEKLQSNLQLNQRTHAVTTKNFNKPEENSFSQMVYENQNNSVISSNDAHKGNLSLMQIVLAGKTKGDQVVQIRSQDQK